MHDVDDFKQQESRHRICASEIEGDKQLWAPASKGADKTLFKWFLNTKAQSRAD